MLGIKLYLGMDDKRAKEYGIWYVWNVIVATLEICQKSCRFFGFSYVTACLHVFIQHLHGWFKGCTAFSLGINLLCKKLICKQNSMHRKRYPTNAFNKQLLPHCVYLI